MLYRLEIENFYSFCELTIIDLTVPGRLREYPERFGSIFSGSGFAAPKVVAFFGPNGSGKSTVLKALSFLAWFVARSAEHKSDRLPCERFNDQSAAIRPVRLALEFGGPMNISANSHNEAWTDHSRPMGTYRYELELATSRGVVVTVAKELLRRRPDGNKKWQRVFKRVAGEKPVGSAVFSLAGAAGVTNRVRPTASLISTLGLIEHTPSQQLIAVAQTVLGNIFIDRADLTDQTVAQLLNQSPEAVAQLNQELQRIDVGIRKMRVISTQNGPLPVFQHDGLEHELPWTMESHGTRSFLRVAPFILAALRTGGVAVIDELDVSIHPLILPEILRWFYDPERNRHDAQLWMSCHSVSLMDDLTKEEIVFCEKDRQGRSKAYRLTDVQRVRRGDNLYKKYLGGVYGAVPHIG